MAIGFSSSKSIKFKNRVLYYVLCIHVKIPIQSKNGFLVKPGHQAAYAYELWRRCFELNQRAGRHHPSAPDGAVQFSSVQTEQRRTALFVCLLESRVMLSKTYIEPVLFCKGTFDGFGSMSFFIGFLQFCDAYCFVMCIVRSKIRELLI